MATIHAYGAQSGNSGIHPMTIERRDPRPDDVVIRIDYCGICHTDILFVHDDYGTHILVGLLEPVEPPLDAAAVVLRRKAVAGSLIGGIPETREMLDFCAGHGIVCDIEMLDIRHINEAYERMQKSDVRYRFVIDMQTLRATP